MKTLYSVLFLWMIGCSALAQTPPPINLNRPRVYVDSTRLATLQGCVAVPGDCQTTWNDFMTAYNGWWINDPQLYLLGSDSTLWHWEWSSKWAKDEAMFTVFIYRITGDTLALKRCRYLAQQVINTIDTANFATMEWYAKEGLLRQMSDVGDVLLDWTYDSLPPALRQQLVQSLYVRSREFMTTFINSSAGTSFVSSHNAWNTIFCNQDALALYNADGLSPEQNDTVWQWYTTTLDKWDNGFLPCYTHYRDDDGGWNWGAAYSMWSLLDQYQLFENMRIATGYSYYTELPWVEESINQYWYFIQPDNKSLHLGDGLARLFGDRVAHLHPRYFGEPRGQWLSQELALPVNTPNTADKFQKLLYRDFTAATIAKPAPPLHWWADKVGLSVARSSWEADATMVSFFNSPSKRAAHEHRDNNSFAIFKHAPLLLDAGHYDSYNTPHYRNYYSRSIAHNTVCVYDSTDSYTAFGQAASNDGGQIESPALQNYDEIFLPENQRGEWVKYSTDQSTYQYTIADAELSYNTPKVKKFRRRTLFLPPNRYIVLDHVVLNGVGLAQRDAFWTGHFANQPTISGSLTNAEVPGHIETFNGTDVVATNGAGKVAMRTLLPQNANITRVGGAGYEFYVDGQNHPSSVEIDTNYYTPGSWRVEVRSPIENDTLIFLHTFTIGDSGTVVEAGGEVLQNTVSIVVNWNDTLIFFAADGDTGICYHGLATDQWDDGTGNKFLIALDMHEEDPAVVDFTNYAINGCDFAQDMDLGTIGDLVSTGSNWLGCYFFDILCGPTNIEESSASEQITITPNPTTGRFKADFPSGMQGSTATITDLLGRSLLQQSFNGNRLELDLSGQAPGLYSVRVAGENGKVLSGKVVVQ